MYIYFLTTHPTQATNLSHLFFSSPTLSQLFSAWASLVDFRCWSLALVSTRMWPMAHRGLCVIHTALEAAMPFLRPDPRPHLGSPHCFPLTVLFFLPCPFHFSFFPRSLLPSPKLFLHFPSHIVSSSLCRFPIAHEQ